MHHDIDHESGNALLAKEAPAMALAHDGLSFRFSLRGPTPASHAAPSPSEEQARISTPEAAAKD